MQLFSLYGSSEKLTLAKSINRGSDLKIATAIMGLLMFSQHHNSDFQGTFQGTFLGTSNTILCFRLLWSI